MLFLFLENRKNTQRLSLQTKCPKRFPKAASWEQYRKQHFGTLHMHLWSTRNIALWIWADGQGASSAWTARTWMCRRPAQASAHNLLTHAGREWSQQSHKSLVCFLHPWPLQRPLFSVLSLPFLKKAPYYPGKSCGFALISILNVFSCFQAWPNIVVIHFHRLKHCLDYLKNPNKQQPNKIPQTKQAPNPTNTTPMTTIQNTTQGWRKCIPFLCQDAITTPFSVDQKTEPVHIIGPHYHTPRTSGQ